MRLRLQIQNTGIVILEEAYGFTTRFTSDAMRDTTRIIAEALVFSRKYFFSGCGSESCLGIRPTNSSDLRQDEITSMILAMHCIGVYFYTSCTDSVKQALMNAHKAMKWLGFPDLRTQDLGEIPGGLRVTDLEDVTGRPALKSGSCHFDSS